MIFRIAMLVSLIGFSSIGLASDPNNRDAAEESFGFASVFHENMVLQMRPYQAVLWGYGTPGAIVNVSLIQDVHSTKVQKGPDGRGVWRIVLKAQPPGGPHTFQGVHDDHGRLNWVLLKNVLFGEVWLCSGQSNMQFTVSMGLNATEEIKSAANYSNIRVMTVGRNQSTAPLFDVKSVEQQWSVASADAIGGPPWTYFSAVCWFYGRYLHDHLNVPIGLISSSAGGTQIDSWMSPKALKNCESTRKDKHVRKISNSFASTNSSVLWNSMIHPFLNMTIRGVIWYQDGFDAGSDLSCTLPAMIQDWRDAWYEGTKMLTDAVFPFGFVQLPSINASDESSNFPLVRWHQTGDYGNVPNVKMPNTFMAVALDLGDPGSPYGSGHPRDKQDVAARLVKGALNLAYGQDVAYQGPVPNKIAKNVGNQVVLSYKSESKLKVKHLNNFEVCCNFSSCDYKQPFNMSDWNVSSIQSHSHKSVTLDAQVCSSKGGKAAVVRYAWQANACKFKRCSIYDDNDLPAPPYIVLVD